MVSSRAKIQARRHTSSQCSADKPFSFKKSKRSLSLNMKDNKNTYKMFLNETLEHLKSVEENSNSLNYPAAIKSDRKMYKEIPYVVVMKYYEEKQSPLLQKISKSNQSSNKDTKKARVTSNSKNIKKSKASKVAPLKLRLKKQSVASVSSRRSNDKRRSNRLSKPIEIIELSDSDTEKNKRNSSRARPPRKATNNTKTQRNKHSSRLRNKLSIQKKSSFKIRLSSKFIVPPQIVEQKSKKVPTHYYTCDVCDKQFTVNYNFKIHQLWHEKPETVIINVTRQELPNSIKASVFCADKSLFGDEKKPEALPDKNINGALNNEEENDTDNVNQDGMKDAIEDENSSRDKKEGSEEKNEESKATNEESKVTNESDSEEGTDTERPINEAEESSEEETTTDNTNPEKTIHPHNHVDKQDGSKHANNDEEEKENQIQVDDEFSKVNDLAETENGGLSHISDVDKTEIIEKQLAILHGESIQDTNSIEEQENNEQSLKRKRSKLDSTDIEENTNGSSEKVMPKTKRVRFASDFETRDERVPAPSKDLNNGMPSEEKRSNFSSMCSI